MSEVTAIRQAVRMDKTAERMGKAVTNTGKVVDLRKGFNVRGPDGVLIPFRPDTPLEKARQWTKNFYAPSSDFKTHPGIKSEDAESSLEKFTMTYEKAAKPNKNALDFDRLGDGSYRVRGSYVSAEHRGQGVGAGMYRQLFEKAKKEGAKVKSDSGMTEASIAIWRRFKELGYPIVEHPHTKALNGKGQVRSDRKLTEDAPLFEYDPLAAEAPALLKKQAE